MGHALLAYTGTAGVNAVNFDFTALTDNDFTQRNGHYTFTEPYRLLASSLVGASQTRGRFQVPHWNAICEQNIYPVNRAANPPSNPQIDDSVFNYPLDVPINEEFQVQGSNNLGAATEQEFGLIWIATPDWNGNVPRTVSGLSGLLNIRATMSFTTVLNAWSGPQAITLSQSLRGGVYAVVGAEVQVTNGVAFRIVFPRYKLYQGRKLRPGGLTQTNIGDNVRIFPQQQRTWLGEWGRFHTFELPQIEVLATTAAAVTPEVRLYAVYLGEDLGLLNQGLGGGGTTI